MIKEDERGRFIQEWGLGWKHFKDWQIHRIAENFMRAVRFGIILASVGVLMMAGEQTAWAEALSAPAPTWKDSSVIVSYYTASPDETDDSPCYTADMTFICPAKENIVAANWLPINTKVEIGGKIYRVADRMNRRYGEGYMDILVESKHVAMELGRQNLKIRFRD